jgi:DNA-binding transcriptional ArsR family regulator
MNQDRLSLTFGALADPTRRAILQRLTKGEKTVAELAKPFMNEMSAPAITKHLRVLVKAGLISKGRKAQWRPCKIEKEALKEVANWMDQYRQFWEESFDRLDESLKKMTMKKGNKNGRKK